MNELPQRQGLYDPQNEHDACGIGFVVDMHGRRSHNIVNQGLSILINLAHRGGSGAESNTGDGAGLLIQIPHNFFSQECPKLGFSLPEHGDYGVGMLFMSPDETIRLYCEKKVEQIIKEEGQELLGWRTVPVDPSSLGDSAKSCMPFIRQIFIGKSKDAKDSTSFERKLYIIRRRAEKAIRYAEEKSCEFFYFASLSSKTIVYKGMLTAQQVEEYYKELADDRVDTALALVHSRYSTNTFPSWERAHPNRYIIHNGEINTLRGNVNWMNSRQYLLKSDVFNEDLKKVLPVINPDGSDSAMFDSTLELLTLCGRPIAHAAMMMVPEPWSKHESMNDEKKAFYEYHSCLLEPWDGPAAIGFTDGVRVGALLDRNGLRPSRYYVTKDGLVVLSSEVGVLDIEPSKILYKERLRPGKMLLVDTEKGRIISDDELKHEIASQKPYRQWLDENLITMEHLPDAPHFYSTDKDTVLLRQKAFGYTYEDLRLILGPIAKDGTDPVGAMGIDTPLAVLSDKPQLLYNYFKQLFAQVTNPPMDALREDIVISTETYMGSEGNLLSPGPENCRQIKIKSPVIDNKQLAKLRYIKEHGFKSVTLPILFNPSCGGKGLDAAMEELFLRADNAISEGNNILILSDRGLNKDNAPIPALLALSGLHHHLIRQGTRTAVSLVLESGEPREVHHFAALIGFGASAINPYLAFESIEDMINRDMLTKTDYNKAVSKYIKTVTKSVVKILSKMGISTIQSYQGAQIFEALGIDRSVVDKYFTGTPTRIGGADLDAIASEAKARHESAFNDSGIDYPMLESRGDYQWRSNGEEHLYNPETIHKLQIACRTNNYSLFKDYSNMIDSQTQKHFTLRGLMNFKNQQPIPIDEVESVEAICKRFKTGAMSYGSISQEAHEAMAIAMNRIGGKSNTGEGGEDPSRFKPLPNGDSKCSAIKQVASGRFGVTSEYLVNAQELQIKMAQGAKPGEGGQLPAKKVYPWVARTRHSTPGVGLISPPPHHDIYSIEDLAELIHDLKNANDRARISVKLVSEVGVGTIAAGVAKGRADVILISGYDGGTGASPRTSIKHAGLPWELGLAEAHQTLLLNNLRSRVVVETDGKLMTGRDVAIAALLGAEEFGFATAPLVTLGCVMMRVCNLDTCPVGVATQNPELRKKFSGDPSYVVNFMHFIAQELREIMAELGFRTITEMVGHTEKLEMSNAVDHYKAKGLDYSKMLYKPQVPESYGRYNQISQNHELEKSLDKSVLLDICKPALENGEKVSATVKIKNINRVVGTILGSEVTRKYGGSGLPEDTINLTFIGSAGQSFGAFVPNGITLSLEGDANDYVGKGLSGGKIAIYPSKECDFPAEENVIIGNVALYGATSGEAYFRGIAGERFCVRNSGAKAVVEGVGDHACEYMTGGRVAVLGPTGRNFAAGMSGGIAYVLDEDGTFKNRFNIEMADIETLEDEDISELKEMIENHVRYTSSELGKRILADFNNVLPKFHKIMPRDYKRMITAIKRVESEGLSGEEALMAAFTANTKVH